MKRKTAVFGLGIIGDIWARHLEEDGWLEAAWNRTPKPAAPKWCADPVEAAGRSEVLISVLADPPAVEGWLVRVRSVLGSQHLVIQSATIDPESSEKFEREVKRAGARYVEAPFTGSKPAAETRELVYYLGGDEESVAAAEPVLERLSATRLKIGKSRQAAALKLSMNLQIAVQAGALSESISYARRAGISDDCFFEALRKNAAWSGVSKLKEEKLRREDFSPQFSVKHMLKDIGLLRKGAPGFVLAEEIEKLLRETADSGGGEEDFISVIRQIRDQVQDRF